MNRKKIKVIYKNILAVLVTITMAGCSKKIEPTQEPSPEVTEQAEEKEPVQETKKCYESPTEVMSPEETAALTEGQFLSATELTKIPDSLTLEKRELTFIYVYTYLPKEKEDPEYARTNLGMEIIQDALKFDIVDESRVDKYASDYRFEGIKIIPIDDYMLDADLIWVKRVKDGEYYLETGPVLSEEKIQYLNSTVKTLSQ